MACAIQCHKEQKNVFLFSYFIGNGEDGLHLAYSYDGFNWSALKNGASFLTPMVGNDKLMRDPCIIQGPDGMFHMVWTVSWGEKGIGYASSKNLINWSEQKYIPVMEHEPDAQNCWAPEILYDDINQHYLIFWATTIPGRFPETDYQNNEGLKGRGHNHRMYYVTTKDFENFSETRIFYDHGFNVIDATIIKAGSEYVMFLKDETNKPFAPQKNIKIAKSEHAEGPYSAASEPITGEYWAEGPTVIKTGDYWHLYFDKYRQREYGVLISPDLKAWQDKSDILHYLKNMRHGTAFKVSEKLLKQLLAV
ncbi:glycosyl hydrolase [candidate division KSB1 bacterium]|nr:glycoside hydrolase family 43 protein [candidate division KSB1 bacterium]RQW05186.1 MAG: glycosyl hydrolase [candidate division KSB1 bacterium]